MADAKKTPVLVSFLNRGQRTFVIGADDKKLPIRHAPGETMSYTADQAVWAARYPKELVDISKLPGQVDTSKLKADNEALLKEKADLQAQLAALQPKTPKVATPEPAK